MAGAADYTGAAGRDLLGILAAAGGDAVMCAECGYTPCHCRCPNYVAKPALYCDECRDGILPGEEYFEFGGINLCLECMKAYIRSAEEKEDF